MEMFCTVCKEPSVLKCKNCQGVYYCGKQCQQKHWPEHKKLCKKEFYNVIHNPNVKVCMSKSKTTKKEKTPVNKTCIFKDSKDITKRSCVTRVVIP